jgi:hypothetical protein
MARQTPDGAMFQIPERYRPGLEKLAVLDNEVFVKLLDVMKNSPPTLHIEDIASLAYKEHSIDREDASDIVRSILSLYSFRETEYFSTNQLVVEISEALQSELSDELSRKTITQLQKRLLEFLEIRGPLEIASKAADLIVEHENVFSSSRVLTDLRPIFKPEVKDGIGGALISHILKIDYENINGTQESFFALDLGDIEQLLEQLERALEKDESLKRLLEKSNIPYLDIYPNSED